jgi:hypothetical protein
MDHLIRSVTTKARLRPLLVILVLLMILPPAPTPAMVAMPEPPSDLDSLLFTGVAADNIEGYLRDHPDASLAQAARYANAQLARYGIDFSFDVQEPQPDPDSVDLQVGRQRLTFYLDSDPGSCGEHWLEIPAARVDRDRIIVPRNGRPWVITRPDALRLDDMVVYAADGKRKLLTVEMPWETEPAGVSPDGRSVYIYYDIGDGARAWWNRLRAADPRLEADFPVLVLAISRRKLQFLADRELYHGQQAERLALPGNAGDDDFRTRLRFKPSGLIVEYSAPCD